MLIAILTAEVHRSPTARDNRCYPELSATRIRRTSASLPPAPLPPTPVVGVSRGEPGPSCEALTSPSASSDEGTLPLPWPYPFLALPFLEKPLAELANTAAGLKLCYSNHLWSSKGAAGDARRPLRVERRRVQKQATPDGSKDQVEEPKIHALQPSLFGFQEQLLAIAAPQRC